MSYLLLAVRKPASTVAGKVEMARDPRRPARRLAKGRIVFPSRVSWLIPASNFASFYLENVTVSKNL